MADTVPCSKLSLSVRSVCQLGSCSYRHIKKDSRFVHAIAQSGLPYFKELNTLKTLAIHVKKAPSKMCLLRLVAVITPREACSSWILFSYMQLYRLGHPASIISSWTKCYKSSVVQVRHTITEGQFAKWYFRQNSLSKLFLSSDGGMAKYTQITLLMTNSDILQKGHFAATVKI